MRVDLVEEDATSVLTPRRCDLAVKIGHTLKGEDVENAIVALTLALSTVLSDLGVSEEDAAKSFMSIFRVINKANDFPRGTCCIDGRYDA